MAKLITQGFTNYFGDVLKIDILEYDNDKYVTVRKPDGTVENIKRGYIRQDAAMKKDIAKVNWFIHGGGARKDFKARVRSTRYAVFFGKDDRREFTNKAGAVAFGCAQALRRGQTVEVCSTFSSGRIYSIGFRSIDCTADGLAVQYGGRNRKRAEQPKFLRGYGRR